MQLKEERQIKFPPGVMKGKDSDRMDLEAVDDSNRLMDNLPQCGIAELRDDAPRMREPLQLPDRFENLLAFAFRNADRIFGDVTYPV